MLGESRTWDADATTASEAADNPSMTLRLPRGNSMTVVVDRVRARPAVTPTIAGTLGQNAMGLGVWGTFFPNSVNRFLGMDANPTAIRTVFGLREFYTAFSLIGDPTRKDALWARVFGDIFDIAVLRSLDHPGNPKRSNARLALGVVLAVTALDAVAAVRMSTVQRNCPEKE
ncbi:MAG TPA: hypothetical protein VIO94_08320 [Phenylobacterium sp.]